MYRYPYRFFTIVFTKFAPESPHIIQQYLLQIFQSDMSPYIISERFFHKSGKDRKSASKMIIVGKKYLAMYDKFDSVREEL